MSEALQRGIPEEFMLVRRSGPDPVGVARQIALDAFPIFIDQEWTYGRLDVPFTGGFSGVRPSRTDLQEAVADLFISWRDALQRDPDIRWMASGRFVVWTEETSGGVQHVAVLHSPSWS